MMANTMRVQDTQAAAAALVLNNIRSVRTLATSGQHKNTVTGLLDTSGPGMPTCTDTVGNPAQQLELLLQEAPESLLRTDCPGGATMTLLNNNGRCLQAVWADAGHINARGNRSIVVYPSPQRTQPTTIDVSGMTSWGNPPAPSSTPTNTRVIVRLSQWQGDRSKAALISIQGRLPYAVPNGAAAVVIHGCGASNVTCTVTDSNGRPSCQAIGVCVASVSTAKANALAAINAAFPCVAPSA